MISSHSDLLLCTGEKTNMTIKYDKKEPLYEQLMDTIKVKIKNDYKADDKLPSEREIMRKYSVSRNTVRQALNELEILGLIYRQHGKGTFVANATDNPATLGNEHSFTKQMIALGRKPETKIMEYSVRPANKYFANKLNINEGDRIIKLKRLRSADKVPVMIDRTYLPFSKFEGLSAVELEVKHRSLYAVFAEDFGEEFRIADEALSAGRISDKDADVLQVAQGSPGLMLKRTTFNQQNEIIEFTLSSTRSDQYVYNIRYKNTKI